MSFFGDFFGPAGGSSGITQADIDAIRDGLDLSQLAVPLAAQLSALALRRLTESEPLVTNVSVVRGTTWRIPITVDPVPEGWTRIEFTARKDSDVQAASLLHIVLTAPAAGTDGLQILRGSPAADAALGTIAVVDDRAIATVAAAAVATAAAGEYCWDCKVTTADGLDQISRGSLLVDPDVTRLAVA